ncbi:peptide/nickel transport system permease protein [Paenibacillus taihuensis]|uniref:Peptide/nickel transport system permease protein n=1 Tax=Paenibacillus taihuensis TaxID=1156355 RepID=A0A3D9QUC2_9BACL|nr:ABC transporter permease [Paenibacillus taihuensis]REE67325.1 peptide/nickel transport system permease protein [Paenibacillus taihuensis]
MSTPVSLDLHGTDLPDMKLRKNSLWRMRFQIFCRNKIAVVGACFVLLLVICALFAPWITPYSYEKGSVLEAFEKPSLAHLLGTDAIGRDVFSRLIYSLRNACIVGFGAQLIELTLGLFIGAIAGYVGGRTDSILMRVVDIVYGFPSFLLSIILIILLGHNIWAVLIAVAATSWVGMARVVRGQVLTVRQSEYIDAARAMGANWWQILTRYVLPNSMGPVLVAAAFGIPANMMVESGLSLVGLGLQPPTPSWGSIIADGQKGIFSYPYLLVYPSLLFAITLLSFTYLGDGLRDAFDSREA